MTYEQRVPYGRPCGPSYHELEMKLKEANETITKVAERSLSDNEFSLKSITKMKDLFLDRVQKVYELSDRLKNSYDDCEKMVRMNIELIFKMRQKTKYAIAACALTAIIAGSAGYYIGKSQLEEKVSNAASIQQQSERR